MLKAVMTEPLAAARCAWRGAGHRCHRLDLAAPFDQIQIGFHDNEPTPPQRYCLDLSRADQLVKFGPADPSSPKEFGNSHGDDPIEDVAHVPSVRRNAGE
jgi:hypothetical protein